MTDEERLRESASDRVIEEGGAYDHSEHGHVEVTGIWRRTRRLDAVSDTGERDMVVVRFVPGEDGEWMDELAAPLEDFLEATD